MSSACLVSLKSILCRSRPFCAKYSLIAVKRENIGNSLVNETGLPPVPFHVKTALGVPIAKMVTGICASSLCSEDAVSVTLYQPRFLRISVKL